MVYINSEGIGLSHFYDIIYHNEALEIDSNMISEMEENFQFLKKVSQQEKVIYGINTGLGPMAQYKINLEDQIGLQYNLIRSHAAGSGVPLEFDKVKGAMVCRLNTLVQARSGIHPDAVLILQKLINLDIIPLIPQHGGVGASGDLVQLAHIALVLIGEGEVFMEGKRLKTQDAFAKFNISPLQVSLREGLGLINGTSVMTGVGLINVVESWKLINWAVLMSSMLNEIVRSFSDHYSEELNQAKKHKGQKRIAKSMSHLLETSKLIKERSAFPFEQSHNGDVYEQKIQEYYSLRCIPQILGPVLDTLECSQKVLINELNSASDNPIIDHHSKRILHGGNFHGDYISLEMDKLKLAIIKLSVLSERQTNFLMNPKLNGILPPFVNLGTLGLNLGMQGLQFAAVSTTAENQALGSSLYIHSISNNNDNQDIVSMGTNAALSLAKVIENSFEILSVELLSLVQAIEILKIHDQISKPSREIYDEVRKIIPAFSHDEVMYPKMAELQKYMSQKEQSFI